MKIEIKFDGRAIALVVTLLFLAGFGYHGWQSFRSGLELRQQTKWIKAIATGADASDLDIPAGDRYGVALMAQSAKTSGLTETDWQTFETEAANQLRLGVLYMAAAVLMAGLAIERAVRKSLPARPPVGASPSATQTTPDKGDRDHQRDA